MCRPKFWCLRVLILGHVRASVGSIWGCQSLSWAIWRLMLTIFGASFKPNGKGFPLGLDFGPWWSLCWVILNQTNQANRRYLYNLFLRTSFLPSIVHYIKGTYACIVRMVSTYGRIFIPESAHFGNFVITHFGAWLATCDLTASSAWQRIYNRVVVPQFLVKHGETKKPILRFFAVFEISS